MKEVRDRYNSITYLKGKKRIQQVPQWTLITPMRDVLAELESSTGERMSVSEFETLLARHDILVPRRQIITTRIGGPSIKIPGNGLKLVCLFRQ